jgi:DNA-binding NarL/FixJ family response regulator
MAMRVLVADDRSIVRRNICALLAGRTDWQVCSEASDGAEAVEQAKLLHPDVALLDLVMGKLNGADAAEYISLDSPSTIILTMSLYDPGRLLPRLQRNGVRGFIPKTRLGIDLIPAIEAALEGHTWF